jgi:hypothetical protein
MSEQVGTKTGRKKRRGGGGSRLAVDLDRVLVIRRRADGSSYIVHTQRLVDAVAVRAVENFCTAYDGDDLLHEIELTFPHLSYRDFYVGFQRYRAAEAALRRGRKRQKL